MVGDSTTRTNGGAARIGQRVRLAYYDATPAGNPLDWFNGVPGAVVPNVVEDFDDLVVGDDSTQWWRQWLDRSTLASLERASAAPRGRKANGRFPRRPQPEASKALRCWTQRRGFDGSPVPHDPKHRGWLRWRTSP